MASKCQPLNSTNCIREEDQSARSRTVYLDVLLEYIGIGPFQVFLFVISCVGYFAFSAEIMLYIFLSDKLSSVWTLSVYQYAILPASSGLMNIAGSYSVAVISDRLGRKWPFIVCGGLIAVFGLGSAFAPSFWVFLGLRSFVSFSIGGVLPCLFPQMLEFLPVRNRGRAMTFVTFCGALGACFCGGIAWWCIPTFEEGWRYLTIACALPNFLPVCLRMFLPFETPRFLLAKGKQDQLKRALQAMMYCNRKKFQDDFGIEFDNVCIVDSTVERDPDCEPLIKKELTNVPMQRNILMRLCMLCCSLTLLCRKPHTVKTILLTVISGCLAVGFWGSGLFIIQYFTSIQVDPYFTLFTAYLAELPGIALVTIIIEWPRVGRLNTIRLFSLIAALSLIIFAFTNFNHIVASVFIIFAYFGMVPLYAVLFTYVPESYPTSIRSVATAYSILVTCIPTVCTPFISGYLSDSTAPWVYPFVWGLVFAIMFLASLFLKYETLNRNLDS